MPKIALEALVAGDFHSFGLEAELMQESGVDVGDVVRVLLGVKTNLVGGAVREAAFETAAGHPHAESVGMMVAAIAALRAGGAAEFSGEDDECFIKHAT